MLHSPVARTAALAASFVFFTACGHGDGAAPGRSSAALVNGQPVVWTRLVNTSVQGDSLVKTGGQPQMEDAGAVSLQQIASGDASLQFTMSETSTFKFVGFGHSPTWPKAAGIDFSFRMQSGRVDVYENDSYVESNTGAPSDVFAIDVSGSTIHYSKNGVLFHTTTRTPTYPLIAAASIIDSGGTIKAAQVAGGSGCGGGTGQPDSGGVDAGSDAGARAAGHHLSGWLAGSSQWADQNPASSDPYLEWFASNASKFDSVNPTWWSYKPGNTNNCCALGAVFCTGYGNPNGPSACINRDVAPAARKAGTKLVPMFAAIENKRSPYVAPMLASASARLQWAQEIASDAATYGYDGVDIDFEGFDAGQRENFTAFMQTLRSLLPAGSILAVAVDGAYSDSTLGGWNLAELATIADQVQIMGYDFHFMAGSHAGPVDPLGWAKAVMPYVSGLNQGTTKQRFIWGLPNYGIEGPDGHTGGVVGAEQQPLSWWIGQFAGKTYSYDASAEFATCPLNDQGWTAGMSPNGYLAGGNHAYFDDIDSLEQRVSAAAAAGLGGITYWTIGGEANAPTDRFPDYFTMVRSYFPKQ